MSKLTKMYVGCYLILHDYGCGDFPPTFHNEESTYDGELGYHAALPGISEAESRRRDMRKPFGYFFRTEEYLDHLTKLLAFIEVLPDSENCKVLELGCGEGWMAEFLSLSGCDVCATSLSSRDIDEAQKRVASLIAKDVDARLQFRIAPMETVHEYVSDLAPFDVVFVYEALHHAFSWERTVHSAFKCLSPGGWFVICNEPNLIHTLVSYRVAKLSNTHEIGMSRRKMRSELGKAGFRRVKILYNRVDFGVRAHWIAAQKGSAGNRPGDSR